MKNRLIMILACLWASALYLMADQAQNGIIVTEKGETINAYRIEISPNTIFYQTSDSNDAQICRMSRTDIMLIKFADGHKWLPDMEEAPAKTKAQESNTVSSSNHDYSSASENERAKSISSPDKVKYIGNKDGKEANEGLLLYRPTDESIMGDKNLTLILRTNPTVAGTSMVGRTGVAANMNGRYFFVHSVDLILTNNSNNMIYVDLGNTFFITNGESIRYYVPSMTSNTQGVATGGSLNLGAVANAMGAGGTSIGKLASGVTVGRTNSSSSTTATFSERILSLPPGATKVLEGAKFIYEDIEKSNKPFGYKKPGASGYGPAILKVGKNDNFNHGDVLTNIESLNIPSVTGITSYSLNEEMTSPVQLKAVYEPAKIIGSKMSKLVTDKMISDKDFSNNYKDCLYQFLEIRKK